MRERPILFNGDMVRAIMAGQKTQTRRVVKPQPPTPEDVRALAGIDYCWLPPSWPGAQHHRVGGPVWAVRKLMGQEPEIVCPFGQPGDRLWVRETWAPRTLGRWSVLDKHMRPLYRASEDQTEWNGIWRPSIHMPRWACRLVLEITDVRVERLQAMPEADWEAEGISFCMEDPSTAAGHAFNEAEHYAIAGVSMRGTPEDHGMRAQFAEQGLDWDSNPWVWVIEFNRINEVSNG